MADDPLVFKLAFEVAELRRLVLNVPRLHRKDLQRRYGVSAATITRWLRGQRLPRPRRIVGPLWSLADLEAWELRGHGLRPVSG